MSVNLGSRIPRRWTEREDQTLTMEAQSQCMQPGATIGFPMLTTMRVSHGSLNDWNRVAAKLPGRTNKDCRKRWSKIGEEVKKGPWDRNEDDRLRNAVREHGHK